MYNCTYLVFVNFWHVISAYKSKSKSKYGSQIGGGVVREGGYYLYIAHNDEQILVTFKKKTSRIKIKLDVSLKFPIMFKSSAWVRILNLLSSSCVISAILIGYVVGGFNVVSQIFN